MPNSSTCFPRRVSFDLTHNVVYLLPTIEECKNAAKQRHREEWQRRSLNEDMLSEDIIAEIQEECSRDSEEELDMCIPVKSCLKKPPTVIPTMSSKAIDKRKKKNSSQKKRKRNHSKAHSGNYIHTLSLYNES